jgi:antiviral helicase SKI2
MRLVGVLLEDGARSGALKVLEICDVDAKRSTRDLLPYLPTVRMLFSPLPDKASRVRWNVTHVMLDDVECLTQTIVKVYGPCWYIKIPRGNSILTAVQVDPRSLLNSHAEQQRFVEGEFVNVYSSWVSAAWEEQDWDKVHELSIRELLAERRKFAAIIGSAKCLSCPQFLKHYGMQHDEWLIKENIQALKMLMSDQNLALLPDYQQRTEVLKDLGFIDEESRVQLKGKVACEIHSADELVLTELILENALAS